MTNNKYVLDWIKSMADLVNPDKIVWIDGSEEQTEALRAEACKTGELEPAAIDAALFENELYTAGQPDVDLLIEGHGRFNIPTGIVNID